MFPKRKIAMSHNGFTLMEVVVVILLIGFLAVVASTRAINNNTDLIATESGLKAHLRYAQAKAMQTDTSFWGIRLNASTDEYWLFNAGLSASSAFTANRILPAGAEASPAVVNQDRIDTSAVNVDLQQIRVGGISAAQVTLTFDRYGVPYAATGTGAISFQESLADTGSPLSRTTADITITLADNKGNSRTITLANETGFVP